MKLFLQIYYALLFFILYRYCYNSINFLPTLEPEYIFFAKPLSFLALPVEVNTVVFLLLALFFCLFSVFKPWRLLRVLSSVCVLVFFSIIYSYGKIDHWNHVAILSSVLVCFFNENKGLNCQNNFFILRLIQGIILSHYFSSGLWKLRNMFSARFEFSLQEIAENYVAYMLSSQDIHPILKFFLDEPYLLGFGYFFVLVFQLTALVPVFFNRFFKFYGTLAILFHLSTGIFLLPYFSNTVLLVLFFFIIAETIRELKF